MKKQRNSRPSHSNPPVFKKHARLTDPAGAGIFLYANINVKGVFVDGNHGTAFFFAAPAPWIRQVKPIASMAAPDASPRDEANFISCGYGGIPKCRRLIGCLSDICVGNPR